MGEKNMLPPEEIMLNIFEYLTVDELLKVAQVSKSWNKLANKTQLWERRINRGNREGDAKEIYKKFFVARKDKKIFPRDEFYLAAHPISMLKYKNYIPEDTLSILTGATLELDSTVVEMEKRNISREELIQIFNDLISIKLFIDYDSVKKYTSQFNKKNSKGLVEAQAPIFKVKIVTTFLNQEIRPKLLTAQINETLAIELDITHKKYIKIISVLLNDDEIKLADEKNKTEETNTQCIIN